VGYRMKVNLEFTVKRFVVYTYLIMVVGKL